MKNALTKTGVAAALLALSSAAAADVHWKISGLFDDGTTLNGSFDINVYGLLGPSALTTQTNLPFVGFTYTLHNSAASNTATIIDFEPGYTSDLHLEFASDLSHSRYDPVVFGFECQGSFACFYQGGGISRAIVSAVATVPEPASWALLVTGFALAGGTLRAARRRTA